MTSDGPELRKTASEETRRSTAERMLNALLEADRAFWAWTDDSAVEGVSSVVVAPLSSSPAET